MNAGRTHDAAQGSGIVRELSFATQACPPPLSMVLGSSSRSNQGMPHLVDRAMKITSKLASEAVLTGFGHVTTARRERAFLRSGAIFKHFLDRSDPGLRRLGGLFRDAYKQILRDKDFFEVSSPVQYCWSKKARNLGHCLAYIPHGLADEVRAEPSGFQTIVFMHGFGGNLLFYLWALKMEFPDSVILSPSWGLEWPTDEPHRILQYVEDMLTCVTGTFDIAVERPWLFAISQGGQAGFELANSAADRFSGYVSIRRKGVGRLFGIRLPTPFPPRKCVA